MKNINYKYSIKSLLAVLILLVVSNCDRDSIEGLELAPSPINGDVFIDGFSGGLQYAAFGNSDVTAFDIDTDITYDGSEAAMVFAVPDFGDPAGSYAGGTFIDEGGRDLTSFNALTFWAKGSRSAAINEVGFGNDFGDLKYVTKLADVSINTNWKKYILPIPDPSKLTKESGMLYYAEGPEEEEGYTFWIDEVKYENIGTIAYVSGAILDGEERVVSAETGETITIDGYAEFSVPGGVIQRIEVAPAYFTYTSSNPSIATVNNDGVISIIDEGEAIITAKLRGEDVAGSLVITGSGDAMLPQEAAPSPTIPEEDVISIFSNVYNNVPVDFFNGYWEFSTALDFDVQVDGDDIKRYSNLNFVGIQFTAPPINASEMTHLHMDIWTPDATDLPAAFKVLVVDFGIDQTFGTTDDSSHEVSITSPLLKTGEWVSLDLPFSNFPGLTSRASLAQIVLSGDLPNIFVDNIYFYDSGEEPGGNTPSTSAPIPTADAGDVISIFSDAYTNVESNLNPDWGQTTVVSEVPLEGNNTLLYSGLNYQGLELTNSLDVSGMTHLHIDYWTSNSNTLNAFLISTGPEETPAALTVPTTEWASIDIPLGDFSSVDLADIIQLKFDGNGDIYLDNIYFYNDENTSGGDTPTTAAPTPTADAGDVISIFSDTYTNIGGNLNPNWGQATVVSEESINGNNTLFYSGLNYQGLELDASVDVSGMTHFHLDVWTNNSTAFNAFLISTGPEETAVSINVPTAGWASIDIPLGDFSSVDLADIIQLKFDGNGDIYLDNIYFYNDENTSGGDSPTLAAPTPGYDAANVISVFSDTYTNIGGNLNPNWGQATVVSEESINGNNTLFYSGLNYQGLELDASVDVSGMTFLHLDFWTANSTTLNVSLISPGPNETPYALSVPTSGWVSVDIPLTAFSSVVDLTDIFQFKFDGDGDIYLDNILFRTE